MFSNAVKIADLDDYITPSQNCVVPIVNQEPSKKFQIQLENEPDLIKVKDSSTKTAKVTLNDCLACSGCVTSAETILIQAQSTDEFLKTVAVKLTVVALSPQSVYSLAKYYGLSIEAVLYKLNTIFEKIGVAAIVNYSYATYLALSNAYDEFEKRLAEEKQTFCAECPGWICYAEKKIQQELIDNISNVKSPQQTLGRLLKKTIKDLYFVSVKPCFDKKLEAVRPDFVCFYVISG